MTRTRYVQVKVSPLLKRAIQQYCKQNFIGESTAIRMAIVQWPPIAELLQQLRQGGENDDNRKQEKEGEA